MRNFMRFAFLLCLLFFTVFGFCPNFAHAASVSAPLFSVSAENDAILPGESVSAVLTPQFPDVSAFVLTAEFDGSISSASAEFSDPLKGDHTYTTVEDGKITVVYAAADGSMPPDAAITLRFRTDAETTAHNTEILITVSDAADADAFPLLQTAESYSMDISFLAGDSDDCSLLSLTPATGQLVPDFDGNIHEYTLEVPFSCKSLEWETVPADGATVRVNRKNLGAGGSTTDFFLTVTAADGKTKSIYTVHVKRLGKETTPAETDRPSSSSASKNQSSGSDGQPSDSAENTISEIFSASETSAAPQTVIHISTAPEQKAETNPLLTVALVLVSAAAGMILVLGAQHLLQKKDPPKDS